MNISGLENNYFLSGNDIWIKVYGFSTPPQRLEVVASNTSTGTVLPALKLFSPDGIFKFNVSLPIRALQPEPNHLTGNTMQSYSLTFTAVFTDPDTPDEVLTMDDQQFIRGGRDKNASNDWYLQAGDKLLIDGVWAEWSGIELPTQPQRIVGSSIVNFNPVSSDIHRVYLSGNCNYKIIKFLNSLGGYQYYIFEYSEIRKKAKGKGSVSRTAYRLREDRLRSIGSSATKTITLKSNTPEILQPIILDLIDSLDVLLYDPLGTDPESRWHRLDLEVSNDARLNTLDRKYQNEITFNLPNYYNRDL